MVFSFTGGNKQYQGSSVELAALAGIATRNADGGFAYSALRNMRLSRPSRSR
jgi:hypothetical protein